MPTSSLADLSLASVVERLKGYGSSLEGDSRTAIHALLQALEAGLMNTLDPVYYLSAIDPGIGKTLSVVTFLRTWGEQGFSPAGSVLIGLSRLQEIETYLEGAGLNKDDVAILTSDEDLNALGVPVDQHAAARVMFTTQQMIERRTRGRSFSATEEFLYQGRPRNLRIWDESLLPASGLTLEADRMASLPFILRSRHPQHSATVRCLLGQIWGANQNRDRVPFPSKLADLPTLKNSESNTAQTVETMKRLSGRDAAVIDNGNGDMRLAGSSTPLPADFAPVVILDASGRVRSTYRVWGKASGNVRPMPAATNGYQNLRVHLWERSAGKVALQDPAEREDIARAVAEVINQCPPEPWLIVSYRDNPIADMIRKAVQTAPGRDVNFLTWGMHHGTNAYAHCKRVVLIGQLTYDRAGYRALAEACTGSGDALPDDDEKDLQAGEYRHNLLQALMRGSARRSAHGKAGSCTAYVVASGNVGARSLLAETFPGCTVTDWSPSVPEATGRAGELIVLLQDMVGRGDEAISKAVIREALGLLPPNLPRLLAHEAVAAFMDRKALEVTHSAIVNHGSFKPYPGGGFVAEDLED